MEDVTQSLMDLRLVSSMTIGQTIQAGSVMVLKLHTKVWSPKRLQIMIIILSNAHVPWKTPVLLLGVLRSISGLVALHSLCLPASLGLRDVMPLPYHKGLNHQVHQKSALPLMFH